MRRPRGPWSEHGPVWCNDPAALPELGPGPPRCWLWVGGRPGRLRDYHQLWSEEGLLARSLSLPRVLERLGRELAWGSPSLGSHRSVTWGATGGPQAWGATGVSHEEPTGEPKLGEPLGAPMGSQRGTPSVGSHSDLSWGANGGPQAGGATVASQGEPMGDPRPEPQWDAWASDGWLALGDRALLGPDARPAALEPVRWVLWRGARRSGPLELIPRTVGEVILHLLGEGPKPARLRALAAALGQARVIRVSGQLPEPGELQARLLGAAEV